MLGLTAVTGPGCWNGPPPQPWHPFQGSSCAFLFKTYYFEVIPNVEESRENSVESSCVSRTRTSRSLASYSRLLILSVRVCLPERFEDGCRRAARRSEAQSACVLKTRAVAPVAPCKTDAFGPHAAGHVCDVRWRSRPRARPRVTAASGDPSCGAGSRKAGSLSRGSGCRSSTAPSLERGSAQQGPPCHRPAALRCRWSARCLCPEGSVSRTPAARTAGNKRPGRCPRAPPSWGGTNGHTRSVPGWRLCCGEGRGAIGDPGSVSAGPGAARPSPGSWHIRQHVGDRENLL